MAYPYDPSSPLPESYRHPTPKKKNPHEFVQGAGGENGPTQETRTGFCSCGWPTFDRHPVLGAREKSYRRTERQWRAHVKRAEGGPGKETVQAELRRKLGFEIVVVATPNRHGSKHRALRIIDNGQRILVSMYEEKMWALLKKIIREHR